MSHPDNVMFEGGYPDNPVMRNMWVRAYMDLIGLGYNQPARFEAGATVWE